MISDVNLEDNWRQLGLEAVVSMAESAPGMVRKCSKLIPLLGKNAVFIVIFNISIWLKMKEMTLMCCK